MHVMTLSGASPTLWRWSRLATSRLCDCQHWRGWRGCGRWSAVARPSWHGGPCRASSHGPRGASLLLRDDRMLRSFRRGNCAGRRARQAATMHPEGLLGIWSASQMIEGRHIVEGARQGDTTRAAPRRGRLSRRGVYQLDPSFHPGTDHHGRRRLAGIRSPDRRYAGSSAGLGENSGLVGAAALVSDAVNRRT